MASVFSEFDATAYPYHFAGTLHVGTLLGGIPSNDKVAEGWLRTKIEGDDDIIRNMVAETMVERGVTADEALKIVNEMKNLNGFKRDERGLYWEGRCLKAALKEAVSIAIGAGKLEQRNWGATRKFLTNYLPEHVFVAQERLYLGRSEADGVRQQFVHTPRYGASITYSEYVSEVDIDFTVVTDHDFSKRDWAMIWLTGQRNGIGASRSMGFGTYEVIRWDQIDPVRKASKAKIAT
jgi:hypothetical protein